MLFGLSMLAVATVLGAMLNASAHDPGLKRTASTAPLTCAEAPCQANADCTEYEEYDGFTCTCRPGYRTDWTGEDPVCIAWWQDEFCALWAACVDVAGATWVVVQSRTDGKERFDRTWDEYYWGFGTTSADHWLGLDNMHELCPPHRPCELRVELTYHGACTRSICVPRTPDGRYFAHYHIFAVDNEADKYRLTVGSYNGTASTAGDPLTHHSGARFSTRDADNDAWGGGSCSVTRGGGGGWWYAGYCGLAHLNGRWAAGDMEGLYWEPVTDWDGSAASSRMLVRPAAWPRTS